MIYFDTHIHLQDFSHTSETELTQRLKKTAVRKCICVSAKESDWFQVAALCEAFPDFIVPAFAIHPWYIHEISDTWENILEAYLRRFPTALVGECGLDFLKLLDKEQQKTIFYKQIQLANKYKRTLLIHGVKAVEDINLFLPLIAGKFVIHSFNGRPEHLKCILQNDGYVSVNAKILNNKTAENILRKIPQNRLLIESDAPYQSQPEDLPMLCEKIALIRGDNLEDLVKAVYCNSVEMMNNE